MPSEALFSNNPSRGGTKNLVEFKAGKMTMKGKMVYPDTRKGQLYVYQSDDSLMHFCWKDRSTGVVEDDLIIFPDDCEFKHVPQCKTGRVYLLRFKSSSKKFFVWLQDLKTDKDEEHCRKINEVLNNPPTPGNQRGGAASSEGDLQNLLSNMSQQQLMQLFGGVGQIGGLGSLLGTMNRPRGVQTAKASTTTASTPVTSSVTRPATTQTPSAHPTLTESPKPGNAKPSTTTTTTTATTTSRAPTDTSQSSTGGNKIQLSDLQNFLSGIPGSADPGSQSGQTGPVLAQFGLGQEAVNAAATGNIEDFVIAFESELKAEGQTQGQSQSQGQSQLQTQSQSQGETPSQTQSDSKAPAQGQAQGQDKTKSREPREEDKKKEDDDEGMALD